MYYDTLYGTVLLSLESPSSNSYFFYLILFLFLLLTSFTEHSESKMKRLWKRSEANEIAFENENFQHEIFSMNIIFKENITQFFYFSTYPYLLPSAPPLPPEKKKQNQIFNWSMW